MKKLILISFWILNLNSILAQTTLNITDPKAFKPYKANWLVAGDFSFEFETPQVFSTKPGNEIIVCTQKTSAYGHVYDLFTNLNHGDIDLSLEFAMAPGSNSGIYLMSRYEVQLFDSWGRDKVGFADCGGIYERWNTSTESGYEGKAPLINAAKAPGLWQKLEINFKAPKFNDQGQKIKNAVFEKVILNSILIHENVEVSGPTRSAAENTEGPLGNLQFQGDHGAVAFKNIQYKLLNGQPASISNITYKTYYKDLALSADLKDISPDESGIMTQLSAETNNKNKPFVSVINASYFAPEAGPYNFDFYAGDLIQVKINDKEILKEAWGWPTEKRTASMLLEKGDHKLEFRLKKANDWVPKALGFYSTGPGFTDAAHTSETALLSVKAPDPIYLKANSQNTLLRSFRDIKIHEDKNHRISHAISVGSPTNLHYAYDLMRGNLFQVWRGEFLDCSPMWNDRGDGSSRPLATPTLLQHNTNIKFNEPENKLIPKGYSLDGNQNPTFKYKLNSHEVTDKILVQNGKLIKREITTDNDAWEFSMAHGKIEKVNENMYSINDKEFFIQTEAQTNVEIRDNKLIALPKTTTLTYNIIY